MKNIIMKNIYKLVSEEILKEIYRSKHIFFKNKQLIATYKMTIKIIGACLSNFEVNLRKEEIIKFEEF